MCVEVVLFLITGYIMNVVNELKKILKTKKNKHKFIAEYFIDNYDRIPFLSISEIANEIGTSKATLVRFAKKIGTDGFYELKEIITQDLQNKINSNDIDFVEEKSYSNEFKDVINIEIDNIISTFNNFNHELLNIICDEILNAKRIVCVGLGLSHYLSKILAYELQLLRINACILDNNLPGFNEQISIYDENDLVIAFSFPPYSNTTIEAVKLAKKQKMKIIGITNRKSAPLTIHSDYNIFVNTNNLLNTNASSAIFVLINVITTELAKRKLAK